MYEELKRELRDVNQNLSKWGLVKLTFGNASVRDFSNGNILIKPSGVNFESLKDTDIVVLDKEGNSLVKHSSNHNPSVDLPTHLELYKNFQDIGAIIHTHSVYSAGFAQANKSIRCTGTTHADYFNGEIPVARQLTTKEIKEAYEKNTGRAIVETFNQNGLHPLDMPACLVPYHGAFVWGADLETAMKHAVILEEVAHMEYIRHNLEMGKQREIPSELLNKHFKRKHGKNAYYGQK